MNIYPEQMEAILVYIKHLNAAEKELIGRDLIENHTHATLAQNLPMVVLGDEDTPIGHLVDEIGGAWSFKPIGGES